MNPSSAHGPHAAGVACAVALWLGLLPAAASGACPVDSGVQLLRQQLLPASPAYYLACGLPAASIQARQIAIADGEGAVAASDCATQVCMFDAGSGVRLSRSSLTTAAAGVELSIQLQPLIDTLRSQAFQPMNALQAQKQGRGITLSDGLSRVEFGLEGGRARLQAWMPGYLPARYRFKPRTLRCPPHGNERVLPQELRVWALQGLAAFAIAADYYGEEPGCSWTQWLVLPMRSKASR